jgi:glucokinase
MSVVGVDIGGTRTRVAVVEGAKIVARRAFPTQGLAAVEGAISEVLAEAGGVPEAIGVGAPAPMDMKAGKILGCPNLPHWRDVAVGPVLQEEFGCPVYLANDATCAALGELVFGHRAHHFIYLTWSTGIGGGIVTGGRVVWGKTGQAGEVGHMVLRPDGPPCRCGKQGCLEAIAAGVGIARAAQERLGEKLTAAEVVRRARNGEKEPLALVDEACSAMGQALSILWEVLEPELFILGGGLTNSWDFLGPRVEAVTKKLARGKVEIALTALGDDVGVLGAAALPDHFPREWASS